MDLEETVRQILSVIGDFLNSLLALIINFFNSAFSFLPAHLRTGVGVIAFIVIVIIIFMLWRRD
jgi:hypothetical protein